MTKNINADQINEKREEFHSVVASKDFIDWQNKVLEEIYDDETPLIKLYGRKFTAVTQEAANKDMLKNEEEFLSKLNWQDHKDEKVKTELQKEYWALMVPNIESNTYGFELDEYIIDDGKIAGLTAKICRYKDTVITSHILEYEMYKLFKDNRDIVKECGKTILDALELRKKIHEGQTYYDVLTKGKNRRSLISVQMMVVYKKDDLYHVVVFRRSDKVAAKPNFWQIVPAGGFQFLEVDDIDNGLNKTIIDKNFSIKLTLYREYLEELYGKKEFEANKDGDNLIDKICKADQIINLEGLLDMKPIPGAEIEYLGNVTDLTTLRPEVSFLLVIHEKDGFDSDFIMNFEGMDLQDYGLHELESIFGKDKASLTPSSAGLLYLAGESELFNSCVEFNKYKIKSKY